MFRAFQTASCWFLMFGDGIRLCRVWSPFRQEYRRPWELRIGVLMIVSFSHGELFKELDGREYVVDPTSSNSQ